MITTLKSSSKPEKLPQGVIRTAFPGTCSLCSGHFVAGTLIEWGKRGWVHAGGGCPAKESDVDQRAFEGVRQCPKCFEMKPRLDYWMPTSNRFDALCSACREPRSTAGAGAQ